MENRILEYCNDVLSEKIVTGELIKLACQRHLDNLKIQNTVEFPYYFDNEAANVAIKTVQIFRHWKGQRAGERIKLEDHQHFYFGSLFGWKRSEDGLRRFITSYKEVARKNAKTTECAMKTIFHLLNDNEPGSQIYFTATKEEQARIGFNDTKQIINKTPELKDLFRCYVKSIVYGDSFMRPLGSDSDTQDGFDPTWGVIDEYHAHPTDKMLNVLESGMGARSQPMIDVITTAGFNKENPCYSQLRKSAINVLRGIQKDESLFAVIHCLDKSDDWEDEKNWAKANPNLGVSVNMDFLRKRYIKAKNEGGTKEVDFKTKNLNYWTDSYATWLPDALWQSCAGKIPELTASDEIYGGLDLASVRDFTSFCGSFKRDGIIYSFWKHYIPEERLKERVKDNPNIETWVRQGWITVTPGDATDYNFVKKDLEDLHISYNLIVIGADPHNASQTIIDLTDMGIEVNPFRQGWVSMSSPTKEVERIIRKKEFIHEDNPVMRWMCANVVLKLDPNENYHIDKSKSGDKVDGMVALVMSIGEMSTPGEEESVYNTRGIIVI